MACTDRFPRRFLGLTFRCSVVSVRRVLTSVKGVAGIDASIGTVVDAHDNSLVESINGLHKTELIKPRRPWRNANHVEAETAAYLGWFNNRRFSRGDKEGTAPVPRIGDGPSSARS